MSPRTIHFRVLDKSPVSGPGRGPPSCKESAALNMSENLENSAVATVMPDVRIPKREERRLPRQCNSQKKGSLLLTRTRASAASNSVVQGQKKPQAQAVT